MFCYKKLYRKNDDILIVNFLLIKLFKNIAMFIYPPAITWPKVILSPSLILVFNPLSCK